METFNLQKMGHVETQGLAKCLLAFGEIKSHKSIECMGFNPKSGFVYLCLDNGINIMSSMGGDVEYMVCNYDTGAETFCDTYEEAMGLFV